MDDKQKTNNMAEVPVPEPDSFDIASVSRATYDECFKILRNMYLSPRIRRTIPHVKFQPVKEVHLLNNNALEPHFH